MMLFNLSPLKHEFLLMVKKKPNRNQSYYNKCFIYHLFPISYCPLWESNPPHICFCRDRFVHIQAHSRATASQFCIGSTWNRTKMKGFAALRLTIQPYYRAMIAFYGNRTHQGMILFTFVHT